MPPVKFSTIRELEALPKGTYPTTFTEYKWNETSKASGQPYYALTFTVSRECDDPTLVGRKLFMNLSMQIQSLWRLKQFLIEMGYPEDDLEEVEIDTDDRTTTDPLLQDVLGQAAILEVEQQIYEGKLSNTVKGLVAA